MENFESKFFAHKEAAEPNQTVDLFSTLKETKVAKKRLYNPRLRTPEAEKVWSTLPDYLERNRHLLSLTMGSEEVAVHLHGSMLVGVGTEGKRSETKSHCWETPPSDVDLFIFVGEPDENEQKYQAEYGDEDKSLPDNLREEERIHRFIKQTNFENEFNRRGDGIIVRVPELISQIKEICQKLSNEQKISEEDLFAIYRTTMLFGSDPLFQTNPGLKAKWRNDIIKLLLESPSGEIVWNKGIRKYFNRYLARYEDNPLIPKQTAIKSHKKRVEMTFEKVLSTREIAPSRRKRAKDYLRTQRAAIQLPEFTTLQTLKDKLA